MQRLLADARGAFDRPSDSVVLALLHDWEDTAQKFAALSKVIVTAHTRAAIAFGVVAPDHPAGSKLCLVDLDEDQ